MDGETLIDEIHKQNDDQTIIVISAYSESSRLIKLIQKGITNFILKPIAPEQLINILYKTCRSIVACKNEQKYKKELEFINKNLDKKVEELSQEIIFTQKVSIEAIGDMVEGYNQETGMHVKRIEAYTSIIVDNINSSDKCPAGLKEIIPFASLLHDIGKIMIPKEILTKPVALDKDEFEIIKTHSKLGGEILQKANQRFYDKFGKDSYLKVAAYIAMYHHEKFDGKGYPEGLKGRDIPLCARVVSVTDVYDALRSKRVYKDGFSHEKSVAIIQSESGKAFDPEVVEVFMKNNHKFDEIFNRSIESN
jgi:putative two-component system response regulator